MTGWQAALFTGVAWLTMVGLYLVAQHFESPTPSPWERWIFRSDYCFHHPAVMSCPTRPPMSTFPSPPPTPTPEAT
jgi:hypothetical protein